MNWTKIAAAAAAVVEPVMAPVAQTAAAAPQAAAAAAAQVFRALVERMTVTIIVPSLARMMTINHNPAVKLIPVFGRRQQTTQGPTMMYVQMMVAVISVLVDVAPLASPLGGVGPAPPVAAAREKAFTVATLTVHAAGSGTAVTTVMIWAKMKTTMTTTILIIKGIVLDS